MTSRIRAGLATVLTVAGLVLGCAAPASAHATLVSTDPADGEVLDSAPDVVTFTFDEPVRLTDGSLLVFDAAGEPVRADSSVSGSDVVADLPEELADGTYVVVLRVVSSDGHPISSSLRFSIGAPSPTVVEPDVAAEPSEDARTALSLLQAAGYLGLLLAGGLVLFAAWVLGPARIVASQRQRLRWVTRASAVLAVGAGALAVPFNGAYQLGLDNVVDPDVLDLTLVGDDLVLVVLQALGLGLAVGLPGRRLPASAGAAVAVLSPAVVGHTRAFDPVALLVVTDGLHLLAGAIWFGGLVGLVLTMPGLARRQEDAAAVLTRFSTLAAAVLAVLVVTGSLLAWRILGSWDRLVGTAYGQLLLLKIGTALLVVGIAGWNRYRLVPRVRSAVGHDHQRRSTSLVGRTVRYEASLLVVVARTDGVPGQPVAALDRGGATDREPGRGRGDARRPPRPGDRCAGRQRAEHAHRPGAGPGR